MVLQQAHKTAATNFQSSSYAIWHTSPFSPLKPFYKEIKDGSRILNTHDPCEPKAQAHEYPDTSNNHCIVSA